jgi:hypothetical protein
MLDVLENCAKAVLTCSGNVAGHVTKPLLLTDRNTLSASSSSHSFINRSSNHAAPSREKQ